MSEFKGPEFHGSTTVGERGQIVLPAKMRKAMGISPGDQLIVMSAPHGGTGPARIMLMKAEELNRMLVIMGEHQQALRDIIGRNGASAEGGAEGGKRRKGRAGKAAAKRGRARARK